MLEKVDDPNGAFRNQTGLVTDVQPAYWTNAKVKGFLVQEFTPAAEVCYSWALINISFKKVFLFAVLINSNPCCWFYKVNKKSQINSGWTLANSSKKLLFENMENLSVICIWRSQHILFWLDMALGDVHEYRLALTALPELVQLRPDLFSLQSSMNAFFSECGCCMQIAAVDPSLCLNGWTCLR